MTDERGAGPAALAAYFDLDPAVTYLNHGSFGAVPRPVREEVRRWQDLAERNPQHFHRLQLPDELARVRGLVSRFHHLPEDGLALVRNVTEAVATVLASTELGAGDEVVLTNHGYGAVRAAVEQACEVTGARLVEAAFPVGADDRQVVDAFASAVTARTRLVVVDQITSTTTMLLPVADVAAAVRAAHPDAQVLVDAAHVPAHLDADPATLGVDHWTGNLYKWAFAPRSTGVLWTAPERRTTLRPLIPSWEVGDPYPQPWDHPGTVDAAAWLAIPAALEFFEAIGGWDQVKRNAELAGDGQRLVAERLGTDLTGLTDRVAPAMRLVRLPDGLVTSTEEARALSVRLSTEHHLEVAPVCFDGEGFVRLTGQVYNDATDYDRASEALLAVVR